MNWYVAKDIQSNALPTKINKYQKILCINAYKNFEVQTKITKRKRLENINTTDEQLLQQINWTTSKASVWVLLIHIHVFKSERVTIKNLSVLYRFTS